MTYPSYVGPDAGRFSAVPYGTADARSAFPFITPVQASKVGSTLVATFGPPPSGRRWLVQRMSVRCTATSVVDVYVGGTDESHWVTYTPSGARDEHDASSPLPVPENQALTLIWSGADVATASAWARIEYWEV